MPLLRYPFTQDALDSARAELEHEHEGGMEDAIRAWLREERFGLERNDDGQMRLVGPWLDS